MSKYNPSAGQVLKKMGKDIGSCVYNLGKYSLFAAGAAAAIPILFAGGIVALTAGMHTIPTSYRLIRKYRSRSDAILDTLVGGIFGALPALSIYAYLDIYQGCPEALAIPVVTNVVSGLYEWQKSAKKRLTEENELERILKNEWRSIW